MSTEEPYLDAPTMDYPDRRSLLIELEAIRPFANDQHPERQAEFVHLVERLVSGDVHATFKKYGQKAEKIYDRRTAGDHTWTGFLSEFLQEIDAARYTAKYNSPQVEG